tara:strand:+ start:743 stop:1018 length:276 start_codon:yes stop_codon:yes gene_type:complete
MVIKAKYLPINKEETLNAQGLMAYLYIHAVKDSAEKLINKTDEGSVLDSLWAKFVARFQELPLDDMETVLHFLHCLEETKQISELIRKELK